PERARWARAMSAELHHVQHIDGDYAALAWAIGCLISSIKVRANSMDVGNLRISRWVLAPEFALCFAPLTFGWLDVLFGMSGVVRLDWDIVERYFLAVPGGLTALSTIAAQAVLGVLGPIGLWFALRLVVLNRPLRNRALGAAMAAAVALIAIGVPGNPATLGSCGTEWDVARALTLFAFPPAAGVLPLLYPGRPSAGWSSDMSARFAAAICRGRLRGFTLRFSL